MERFFPAEKIVMSGNPIRSDIVPANAQMVLEGMEYYGLDPQKDHILIVGGSLGSGTLNKAMKHWIEQGCPGGDNVEIIWQCGKYYKKGIEAFMAGRNLPFIHFTDFIGRMDYAYAVADVVISRSGASTVSELCAAHKASIFVPSPNVAEDHQTHNAMALVNKDAALMVRDAEAPEQLLPTALALLRDEARIQQLEANMALTNAAQVIADEAYKLVDVPSISLTENRGYARSTEGTSTNDNTSLPSNEGPVSSGEGAYSLVPCDERLTGTWDIKEPGTYDCGGVRVKVEILDRAEITDLKQPRGILLLDAGKLPLPLIVRPWRAGDWLVPLGMHGRKKLSDLFVDLKYSILDKQRARVIDWQESRIAALLGERGDDALKVTSETRTVYRITIS